MYHLCCSKCNHDWWAEDGFPKVCPKCGKFPGKETVNAVIKLNVPDWQIGQEVSIYFPDTMVKHATCEELITCEKCKFYPCTLLEYYKGKKHSKNWFCADGKAK